MNDSERLAALRKVLDRQIAWYKEADAKEKSGEVDESYIYDTAYEEFNNLSNGAFAEILAILAEDGDGTTTRIQDC